MIHTESLTEEGKSFLPQLRKLGGSYYLAGGTALALQLGHRVSVDFDFFSSNEISSDLLTFVEKLFAGLPQRILVNNKNEFTLIVGETKITFLYYPFSLLYSLVDWENIKLSSIEEIAAMKAYTIGRRGTFKDYVDLYYVLISGATLESIIESAEKKYNDAFNSRLFLEQLVYFEDITDTNIRFIKPAVSPKAIEDFFEEEIKKIKLSQS
ncbi:MAG: nucleotidyl transferase AbiEii/AbiGii toxin family protein [Patescibacteria group bacterium]